MTVLRVATFNIRHGVGADGRLDLARTAVAIAGLGADVVGLQEVDHAYGPRSRFEDQATRLGSLLDQHVRFGAVIDRGPAGPTGERRRYGLALLARTEILEHHLHLLPADPGRPAPREPRGVLAARVAGTDHVTFLVTHLDNRDRAHRAAQVQGILQHVEALDGPVVLMGDMNADPSAPELASLVAAGFRDGAWEAARRSGSGRSTRVPFRLRPGPFRLRPAPSRLRPAPSRLRSLLAAAAPWGPDAVRATHPSHLPRRRLDSIWVRGDIDVTDLEVQRTFVSDHRPVVATIRV